MNDVELERLLGFNVDQAHKLTIKCEEENASLLEKVKNLKNKLDKNILGESCYHRIKCSAANSLAALI